MIHNGSHTTIKIICYFLNWRCEPLICESIEIYCLARVNRKKKDRISVNNKTYFRLSASMSPRKPFREIILPNKILT